jgi:hypothetical protein
MNTIVRRIARTYDKSTYSTQEDAQRMVDALYYPDFRESQVFGSMSSPRAVAGIINPTGPLWHVARLKVIGVFLDLNATFQLDEDRGHWPCLDMWAKKGVWGVLSSAQIGLSFFTWPLGGNGFNNLLVRNQN